MKRTIRFLGLLALAGVSSVSFLPVASAQVAGPCNCAPVVTQRVVYKTIWEQEPYTAQKLETSQEFIEQEVRVQKPVWTTEHRQRKYLVQKPFVETETREEKYTVLRAITEQTEREEVVDQWTTVTETEMRREKYIVNRPYVETSTYQQQHTVRRAVQETVLQDQTYTAYSPVTTYYNQTVDAGGYVTQYAYQAPGAVRNRLTWVPRGYAVDPATNTTFYHRAGLHWVPYQRPAVVTPVTSYMPNYVTQQVPVTSYQPQIVAQKVPINVTRYVDDVVTQDVPVSVTKYQQVEEEREYPVTVQKPVLNRIVRKIPVTTTRYEPQEMSRPIQVQVQKIATEEVVENYDVHVQSYEIEVRKIQVPRTVQKWVPYTAYRLVPKTVRTVVPVGAYGDIIQGGTTTYYPPAPTLPPTGTSTSTETRRLISDGPRPAAVQRPAEEATPVKPREEADNPPVIEKKPADPALNGPDKAAPAGTGEAPGADPSAEKLSSFLK